MSITNYTLDKCKYIHSKLKNVLYLISEDHVKDIHIDNGEAYISGLTELPLRINGFNIQYSEETSLDERYKFEKKITLSMKGYVNYKVFGGRYYAIVEDNDGIYYMVNVDFPSRITHTFNLSHDVNQTDFTFHSLSNFPTIKLNADFEADNLPCLGYNVYGIDSLKLIYKNYARLDTENKTVATTDAWRNIEFIGNSCSLQEVYDGEKVTDTISFQIPLNHKIGWSWNLLEFLDNLYASIIVPKGGDNVYYSGFNFGLEPSYSISSSSNNGESDIITVTLVESSNYGLTAAVDYEEEDYDTTHWRYVKYVDEVICYECVGYARARYLVQQEVDSFGNPTGDYKVKDGYQSQYQMLNVVGTFSNDEQFTDIDCAGQSCKLNTNIPSVITYSAATCHTYTLSASCDWNISGLAPYMTATPSSGSGNTQYSVSICSTSFVAGQETTFNINYGSSVRMVNVKFGEPSFINPTSANTNCLEQNVVFTFDSYCPVTVTSNPYSLTYQITNSNLIVTIPRNYNESATTYSMTVENCYGNTQTLTINQDKTYVKWVSSGYMCVSGSSYVKEIKYTGATNYDYTVTSEYRQGTLITSGDTRCQSTKKWEFRNHYYCIDGNKYECIEEVESYDGVNWTPTYQTTVGNLVESSSTFCNQTTLYEWRLNTNKYQCEGIATIYRWTDSGTTCIGYDKYQRAIKQVSYDGGTTWENVSPAEYSATTLIEANSTDCGYDYSTQYLTFVPTESGTFSFSGSSSSTVNNSSIQYSTDNGYTWKTLNRGNSISVSSGNKVMWKSSTFRYTLDGIGRFSSTGKFNIEGNIMSLLYGDNFSGQTILPEILEFSELFRDCINVISAENLILPATTLTNYCYREMFRGCTSLTTAPELPATTMEMQCYYGMFSGCTSLTTVPNSLPATDLSNTFPNGAYNCYSEMFHGCTSLTTAPELPATTLIDGCYSEMFQGCTSLTTAPELPATTLIGSCYQNMFYGCTSLNYVKCLATDISANNCTNYWLNNVSSTGTFVKASSMSGWPTGADGIPNGWTVQNA